MKDIAKIQNSFLLLYRLKIKTLMNIKPFYSGVLPLLLTAYSLHTQAQNMVMLSPADSPSTIIEKAACVVPSVRQYAWQQQELTAFLHFGMNTFTNKEWGEGTDSPSLFNPTNFDAEQWIKTLRNAGFKTAILTCKHHDGFCLWQTAYTDYSVKSSPWLNGKGDVVRAVSDACKKYGMGFGVYLSPWDRNSKFYGTSAYNDYFVSQLKELLTQYGEVSEVWFDGACGEGPNGKKQEYDFVRWYKIIRELQPKAVIAVMGPDVRWVGTESGRGRETEWSVVPMDNLSQEQIAANSQKEMITPPSGDMVGNDLGSREKIMQAKALVWYPAETDVSIRPGWFYHQTEDDKVKTPKELMEIYYSSVGRNGVLLLNVPPTPEGLISQKDVASLMGFKQLLDKTFQTNLLAPSKNIVKVEKAQPKKIDASAYYMNKQLKDIYSLSYTLRQPISFNVIALQEDILKGQRVEKFVVEVRSSKKDAWRVVAEGTTIGYKRLLRIPTCEAKQVRLRVLEARGQANIAFFGVYQN